MIMNKEVSHEEVLIRTNKALICKSGYVRIYMELDTTGLIG
jgi:hypothetical protein